MQESPKHPADVFTAECVQHIHELDAEIDFAIRAISENSLLALEESLWKQELYAARLNSLVRALLQQRDRDCIGCVRDACAQLVDKVRLYGRVLEQAQTLTNMQRRSAAMDHALSCGPGLLGVRLSCEG